MKELLRQQKEESFAKGPLFLEGLEAIAEHYDGYILDIWGVLHNGVRPFPGVIECLKRLGEAKKTVVLLSNAPRRADSVIEHLEVLGIPRALYHAIMTSGEHAYLTLHERQDPWYQSLGDKCFSLGHPTRHRNFFKEINFDHVSFLEEADFILLTGPTSDVHRVEDYEHLLQEGAALKLPMICVNPDLSVFVEGQEVLCAGSLARRYEELGGEVRYHGKPYPGVYKSVFTQFGGLPLNRILAIGDALATDIKGAVTVGIDSALVCTGIHGKDLGVEYGYWPPERPVAHICAKAGIKPTYVLPSLQWGAENECRP